MHPNYLMNCLAGGVSEKLVIHIFVKLISLVDGGLRVFIYKV